MNILISGGTGLIGSALAESLYAAGHQISIISRNPQRVNQNYQSLPWDESALLSSLGNTEAVINLAGASLAGENPLTMRWTENRKKAIISSRTSASQMLVESLRKIDQKPEVFLQASAIGFYGNEESLPADEATASGGDFLAQVCREWESSSTELEQMGVRRLVLRIGLVLSRSGGLLPLLALPFRFFMGGRLGTGAQTLSWIDIQDIVGSMTYLMENPAHQGVYNLCSPHPVSNREFTQIIAKTLSRPAWMHLPAPLFKVLLGEAATLALDGRPVYPARLLKAGYQFRFPDLESSLNHQLK